MKQLFFFLVVSFLIHTNSVAQNHNEIFKKVLTKSDDIVNEIMQSHIEKKSNEPERTVINTESRVDGYVLVNKIGQYWDGAIWVNSSNVHYTYNPQGQVIEEIDQLWENNSWLNSRRFITTYYENDLISLYEEFNWNGATWENSYQYISTYNSNNKIIEYNVKQWNGASWDNMYKTIYSYYAAGNLQTIIDQSWNGTSWDNNYRYTYYYNVNNNVSEKIEEQWVSGSWVNSIKDVYSYNAQNLVSLIASYWWPGAAWKESVEIYYQYDANGNIIDRLTKFWESEVLGLQNKYHTTIEYLPGTDLETKIENQEWDLQNQVWFNTSRDNYFYNGNNILTLYIGEGWTNGNWEQYFQDIYSLDANGNVDTLLSQYKSGTEWINSFQSIYSWSAVVPVELTSFNANINETSVNLSWTTATETNNLGFEIERKLNENDFVTIGFVKGNGTTLQPQNYSFNDLNLMTAKYVYRLKQVDFNGSHEYSNEIEVDFSAPVEYSLEQNYPNPFNPSTKIEFNLASDSKAILNVYNVLGKKVATILNRNMSAGKHSIDFNAAGLNSGVYFYTIEAEATNGSSFSSTKKMIVIK